MASQRYTKLEEENKNFEDVEDIDLMNDFNTLSADSGIKNVPTPKTVSHSTKLEFREDRSNLSPFTIYDKKTP